MTLGIVLILIGLVMTLLLRERSWLFFVLGLVLIIAGIACFAPGGNLKLRF